MKPSFTKAKSIPAKDAAILYVIKGMCGSQSGQASSSRQNQVIQVMIGNLSTTAYKKRAQHLIDECHIGTQKGVRIRVKSKPIKSVRKKVRRKTSGK